MIQITHIKVANNFEKIAFVLQKKDKTGQYSKKEKQES